MQSSPLAGTSMGARRGFARGDANALAARMVLAARLNAGALFNQRTTSLITSVIPIVRGGRGGNVEVGVGTTVEHGKWLEIGTDEHIIKPEFPYRGKKKGGYFLRSNGPRSKGFNPTPLDRPRLIVQAPALDATHWMSDAVRSVMPGLPVRVRVLK